ncbi:[protein release factor]-glutamine N5-methyltransferase [Candidatus Koribacter versatilis Ellin345]|uniref:Release factor glutamine methyltransferase n=1 Tax=Koribacter versatilis (strain Ellin345) TaxID=204669 RepID=PRMC_KORVE|nr:peptide chain release factor N(5)-glutamine methyltransferase [Candidatus Koribacter versatilis]Q1II29.1 RecName: Full=Release factor glutamine methyltransferase; Short=RF MTase; AltName: Full=N5-glutamine methyltransferase PrmC; AltName: Full=Protein-(glutamine-N5) MTase PrmC; AltName: Full=Protein-glutamine N-methyltransferase PrmC [Candidatus Koribacter versatilis Ellin345]ABF43471.1 [protein release factor]-glutamine N5-methyltransferase [Candidatus Koribacter versatilis Ellin345]
MTLKQAFDSALKHLEAADTPSPRLSAELLLMFSLNCDRAYLFTYPERELTADEQARYDEAIARRCHGEPAQYITGHQEFYGRDFLVSPAVLIPRPETEHLIEAVLELAPREVRWEVLDVGTGSGCIAATLAKEFPRMKVTAVDISPEALQIAQANAARLEAQVEFRVSDLLSAIEPGRQFDMIVSNPPYVGECEADKVQRQVKDFEPHCAVFGGERGMDIIKRLAPQVWEHLKPGGWFLMEIGYSIADPVHEIMRDWTNFKVVPDLRGIPRVVVGRKPTS